MATRTYAVLPPDQAAQPQPPQAPAPPPAPAGIDPRRVPVLGNQLPGEVRALDRADAESYRQANQDAAAAARAAAAQVRADAREQKTAETALRKATNAGLQEAYHSTGQKAYTNAEGNVVPVRDAATGKPVFEERKTPMEWDKVTGRAFHVEQGQDGAKKQVWADANAPVGPNPNDPRDEAIYRQNKFSPWERYTPEEAAMHDDPAIRSAGEGRMKDAAIAKAKDVAQSIKIENDLADVQGPRPTKTELENAGYDIQSADPAIQARGKAVLDREQGYKDRAQKSADAARTLLKLQSLSASEFARGEIAKKRLEPATPGQAAEFVKAQRGFFDRRKQAIEAQGAAIDEEAKGLASESEALRTRLQTGYTDAEAADLIRAEASISERAAVLRAKQESHVAEAERFNAWQKSQVEDAQRVEAAAKAGHDAINTAFSAAQSLFKPTAGRPAETPADYTPAKAGQGYEEKPLPKSIQLGDTHGWGVSRVLKNPNFAGYDVYLPGKESNREEVVVEAGPGTKTGVFEMGNVRLKRPEDAGLTDGTDTAQAVKDGARRMGVQPEILRELAKPQVDAADEESKLLEREDNRFRDDLTARVKEMTDQVVAGKITGEQLDAAVKRLADGHDRDFRGQREALLGKLGQMRSWMFKGGVPVNKVMDMYRRAGITIKDVPPVEDWLNAAAPSKDTVESQKTRQNALLEYIKEFSDQPLYDEHEVAQYLQNADDRVKGAAIRALPWLQRQWHTTQNIGLQLAKVVPSTMQFLDTLLGDRGGALDWRKMEAGLEEKLRARGSVYTGESYHGIFTASNFVKAVESSLPSVVETLGWTAIGAGVGSLATPGAGTVAGGELGFARGVANVVTRFAARRAIAAEAAVLRAQGVATAVAERKAAQSILMGAAREAKAGVEGAALKAIKNSAKASFGQFGAALASVRGNAGEYLASHLDKIPIAELERHPEIMDRAVGAALAMGLPAGVLDVVGPLAGAEKQLGKLFGKQTLSEVRHGGMAAAKELVREAAGDVSKEFLTGFGQGVLGVLSDRLFKGREIAVPLTDAELSDVMENAFSEATGGALMHGVTLGKQSYDSLKDRFGVVQANRAATRARAMADTVISGSPDFLATLVSDRTQTPVTTAQVQAGLALAGTPDQAGDVVAADTALQAVQNAFQTAFKGGDWAAARAAKAAEQQIQEHRRAAAETHVFTAVQAAQEMDAAQQSATLAMAQAQQTGDQNQMLAAQQQIDAVHRARAVVRISNGGDINLLPDAELAAIGYQRDANGGVAPVPGVAPAVSKGIGGGWIVTDAAIQEAQTISPAAAGLIADDEHSARIRDAMRGLAQQQAQQAQQAAAPAAAAPAAAAPAATKPAAKPGPRPAPTIEIPNIGDLVKKGGGVVQVTADGRRVNFKQFGLSIDGNTAEVAFVELDSSERGSGLGLEAYRRLGEELAARGITLQSSKAQTTSQETTVVEPGSGVEPGNVSPVATNTQQGKSSTAAVSDLHKNLRDSAIQTARRLGKNKLADALENPKPGVHDTIKFIVSALASLQYDQLRVGDYGSGSEWNQNTKGADIITGQGTPNTLVVNDNGWHFRLPKNRNSRGWSRDDAGKNPNTKISANVFFTPELVSRLDDFFQKVDGYYKLPSMDQQWDDRHDPFSAYLVRPLTDSQQQELAGILKPNIRNTSTVNDMLGVKIADGIFLDSHPTADDADAVVAEAHRKGGKEFGDAVKAYLDNGRSSGTVESARRLVNSLSGNPASSAIQKSSGTASQTKTQTTQTNAQSESQAGIQEASPQEEYRDGNRLWKKLAEQGFAKATGQGVYVFTPKKRAAAAQASTGVPPRPAPVSAVWDVDVTDASGNEKTVRVEAESRDDAERAVAESGVGMVRDVRQVAPEPQASTAQASTGNDVSAMRSIAEDFGGVFAGIEVETGNAGTTGGARLDVGTRKLIINAPDLAASLAIAKDPTAYMLQLAGHEAIHACAVMLEERGSKRLESVWKSLPAQIRDTFRTAYPDTNDYEARHEFLRMVMEGRVSFSRGRITVQGLTEQQIAPEVMETIQSGIVSLLKEIVEFARTLAGLPPKLAAEIEALANDVISTMQELQGDQSAVTVTARENRTPSAASPAHVGATGGGLRGAVQTMNVHGENVRVQYIAQEASETRPSHDASGNVTPGYNQDLQPRDRSLPEYQVQAQNIARNLDFAQAAYFPNTETPATTAEYGPPVMTPDGDTLIGNGREIGTVLSYKTGEPAAQKYRQDFIDNAARFGLDPKAVAAMRQPVLKRVILDALPQETLLKISRDSNEGQAMASNAVEKAATDAAKLTPQILTLIDPEYDLDAKQNEPFVQAYARQIIGGTGVNVANVTGPELIQRARLGVFVAAYGLGPEGRAALGKLTGETDDAGARKITRALTTVAPIVARMRADIASGDLHDRDISTAIGAAVQRISVELRDQKKAADAWDALSGAQMNFDLGDTDPLVADVLAFIVENRNDRGAIEEAISNYVEALYRQGNPKMADMFGGEAPSAGQLWGEATGMETTAREVLHSQAVAAFAGDVKHFTPDTGTLGIPRSDMPQVVKADRPALFEYLRQHGVEVIEREVVLNDLKPTQAEYYPDKVERWRNADASSRDLLISEDGYVLDGHHQWLALKEGQETGTAYRVGLPVLEALAWVESFPLNKREGKLTTLRSAPLYKHIVDGAFRGGWKVTAAGRVVRLADGRIGKVQHLAADGTFSVKAGGAVVEGLKSSDVFVRLTQEEREVEQPYIRKLVRLAELKARFDQTLHAIAGALPGRAIPVLAPLKGAPRALEKAAQKLQNARAKAAIGRISANLATPEVVVQGMADVLRGSVLVDDISMIAAANTALVRAFYGDAEYSPDKEGNFVLSDDYGTIIIEDRFASPTPAGYSDVQAKVGVAANELAEVQIHIPEMLVAKEGNGVREMGLPEEYWPSAIAIPGFDVTKKPGHKLFEIARAPGVDETKKAELEAEMRELYAAAKKAHSDRVRRASASASARVTSRTPGSSPVSGSPLASAIPSGPSQNMTPPATAAGSPSSSRKNRASAGRSIGVTLGALTRYYHTEAKRNQQQLRSAPLNKLREPITVDNIRQFAGGVDVSKLAETPDALNLAFAGATGARVVPLSALQSFKNELEDPKFMAGLKPDPRQTAAKYIALAIAGEEGVKKRAPLEVEANGDGTFVIQDGNATAQALMLAGWTRVPVVVVNEQQLRSRRAFQGGEADLLGLWADTLPPPAKASKPVFARAAKKEIPAAVRPGASGLGELFDFAQASGYPDTHESKPSTKRTGGTPDTPATPGGTPAKRPGGRKRDKAGVGGPDLFDWSGAAGAGTVSTGFDGGAGSSDSIFGGGTGTDQVGNVPDGGTIPETDQRTGGDSSGPDRLPPVVPEPEAAEDRNHRIEKLTVAPRTRKAKLEANFAAMALLRQLDDEGRNPTAEERAVLEQYTGWGWAKEAFNETRAAKVAILKRDTENAIEWEMKRPRYGGPPPVTDWKERVRQGSNDDARDLLSWHENYGELHERLKKELSAKEFKAAAHSVLNAHFTTPAIIRAMWDAVERLGFRGGRAMEPGAGVGHFIGVQPDSTRERTSWDAVELDTVTARILARLYPQARVNGRSPSPKREMAGLGFQDARIPNNSLDLLISNVPFAQVGPGVAVVQYGQEFNLHNYFFAHALAKVKPGGLIAFITTANTMESQRKQRDYLNQHGELIAAWRLPNDAFAENAGTEVVTDVIFMRKPDGTHPVPYEPWRGRADVGTDVITMKRKKTGMHYNTPVYADLHEWLSQAEPDWIPVHEGLAEPWKEWMEGGRPKTGKKWEAMKKALPGDTKKLEFRAPIRVNEYFARHPENILGTNALSGSMYSANEYTVNSNGDLNEQLAAAVARLPENIMAQTKTSGWEARAAETGDKIDSYIERDGIIYQVSKDGIEPVDWNVMDSQDADTQKANRKKTLIFRSWVKVRDAALRLVDLESTAGSSEEELADARAELNRTYDATVAKYGAFGVRRNNPYRGPQKNPFLDDDPAMPLMEALEDERRNVSPTGAVTYTYHKADIFRRRVIEPKTEPTSAGSTMEAVATSMAWRGTVDADYIARLLGISVDDARGRLLDGKLAFEDPATGLLMTPDEYLSGPVGQRLRAAIQAAEDNPAYQKNVDALREVQPPRRTIGEISMQIGSRWVPARVYAAFLRHVGASVSNTKRLRTEEEDGSGNLPDEIVMEYDPQLNRFNTNAFGGAEEWKVGNWSATDIVTALANNQKLQVEEWDRKLSRFVVDPELTAQLESVAERMKSAFQTYLRTTEETVSDPENPDGKIAVPELVEEAFNETVNGVRPPEYVGDWVTLPGQSGIIWLKEHRKAVLARLLTQGYGMMAHGVGSGKTYNQIALAMELRRLGKARKPVIVVQNSTINQFAASFRKAYPQAKILVATPRSYSAARRAKFTARIATGDWDAIILTHSNIGQISNSQESVDAYFDAELEDLNSAILAAEGGSDEQKALQKARDSMLEKRMKMVARLEAKADNVLNWEQLGVDAIIVDEAHAFKNAPVTTNRGREVKNIPSSGEGSDRALSMILKTADVRNRNMGKGVYFATGTPISNTMAEAFVMIRYIYPKALEEMGIRNFDDFAATFGAVVSQPEANWKGKVEVTDRFAKFVNGPQFINLIRSVFDVAMGNENLGIDVPTVAGGKPEQVIVPATPVSQTFNDWVVNGVAPAWESITRKDIEENPSLGAVPILTMQAGIAAALDPRLIHDKAPDHPDSKLNKAIASMVEIYRQGSERKTAQVVFTDLANSFNMDILSGFAGHPFAKYGANPGKFSVTADIKAKLIKAGIPEREIAVVTNEKDEQLSAIFDRVNSGEIRIIIGSTAKLGVGVNIQERLAAAHHLMPPRDFKPAMMEQRNGRIIRQGNLHAEWRDYAFLEVVERAAGKRFEGSKPSKKAEAAREWLALNDAGGKIAAEAEAAASKYHIRIREYATEKSLDSAVYSMMAAKQGMIAQALTATTVGQEFEDPTDEIRLSMAEMAALTIGDPLMIRQVVLDRDLRKLMDAYRGWERQVADRGSELRRHRNYVDYAARALGDSKVAAEKIGPVFTEREGNPVYEFGTKKIDTADSKSKLIEPLDLFLAQSASDAAMKGLRRSDTTLKINGRVFKVVLSQDSDGISGTVGAEGSEFTETFHGGAQSLLGQVRRLVRRIATWPEEFEQKAIESKKRVAEIEAANAKDAGFADEKRLRDMQTEMMLIRMQMAERDKAAQQNTAAMKAGMAQPSQAEAPPAELRARSFVRVPLGTVNPLQGHRRFWLSRSGEWAALHPLVDHGAAAAELMREEGNTSGIPGWLRVVKEGSDKLMYSGIPNGRQMAELESAAIEDGRELVNATRGELRSRGIPANVRTAFNVRRKLADVADPTATQISTLRNMERIIREWEEQNGQDFLFPDTETVRPPAPLDDLPREQMALPLAELRAASFTNMLRREGVNLDTLAADIARASQERPGERTTGRPDLALGADDPIIMGVDEARRVEAQTIDEWDRQAEAMLKTDYAGTVSMLISRGRSGGTLNPVETRAAQMVVARESRRKMTPNQQRRMQWLVWSYRITGTEAARQLSARRDPHKTPAERHREFLMKLIFTPPPAVRTALEAADIAERERIMTEQSREIDRVRAEMKRMGVSLDDVFSGEVAVVLRNAPILQQITYSLSVAQRSAVEQLQTGASYGAIAKATGLSAGDVERLHASVRGQARDAIVRKLREMRERAISGSGLRSQAVGSGQVIDAAALAAMSDMDAEAAIEAIANRMVEQMGLLPKERQGKVKRAKRKLFRPPPAAPVTTPAEASAWDRFKGRGVSPPGTAAQRSLLDADRPDVDETITGSATHWGRELFPDLPPWEGEHLVPVGADLSDVKDVVKLARAVGLARATPFDMLTEFWINNLLSGPATHVRNLVGNVASIAWTNTIQRGLESMLHGRPEEMKYLWKGLAPGIQRGWRLAKLAWAHEADFFRNDVMNADVEFEGISQGEASRAAIPGKVGRVIRMPGRFLAFCDAFFKGLLAQMEAGAQAYRIAKAAGLTGDALTRRMQRELNTPGSEAWTLAVGKAEEATFQTKLRSLRDYKTKAAGPVSYVARGAEAAARAVMDFSNGYKLMKWVVPFVRTPYNILRTGVRISPAGSLLLAEELITGGFARIKNGRPMTKTHPQMVQHLAEQMIAWTAAIFLAGAVEGGDDDEDSWLLITGTKLKDGEKDLQERTYPATSIRLFGKWFNYGSIEPVATALGLFADAVRTHKTGSGSLVATVRGQIDGKTFLQGLSRAWDNTERIAKGNLSLSEVAFTQVVQTFVPNLLRQSVRATDDYERDWKTRDWWHEAWPDGSGAAARVSTTTGEPVEKPGNVASRLLFPFLVNAPQKITDADRMLLEWNRKNPEAKYSPEEPDRRLRLHRDEKPVELGPKAYEFLQRRAAALARDRMPAYRTPDKRAIDEIRDAISEGRERAREELKRWPAERLGK